MKIQQGVVRYKDRSDLVCNYGITDDGKQYYFLDDRPLSNGNIIASTTLVEAVDPTVKASHAGVITKDGKIVIPLENKMVKNLGNNILLVERATPITDAVLEAIKLKNVPEAATKLVTTPATIKDRLMLKMENEGRFVFNDQFSEASIFDYDGKNLIDGEYFSFIGMNSKKIYFSKNVVDSEIVEYSIFPEKVAADDNAKENIKVENVAKENKEKIENAINSQISVQENAARANNSNVLEAKHAAHDVAVPLPGQNDKAAVGVKPAPIMPEAKPVPPVPPAPIAPEAKPVPPVPPAPITPEAKPVPPVPPAPIAPEEKPVPPVPPAPVAPEEKPVPPVPPAPVAPEEKPVPPVPPAPIAPEEKPAPPVPPAPIAPEEKPVPPVPPAPIAPEEKPVPIENDVNSKSDENKDDSPKKDEENSLDIINNIFNEMQEDDNEKTLINVVNPEEVAKAVGKKPFVAEKVEEPKEEKTEKILEPIEEVEEEHEEKQHKEEREEARVKMPDEIHDELEKDLQYEEENEDIPFKEEKEEYFGQKFDNNDFLSNDMTDEDLFGGAILNLDKIDLDYDQDEDRVDREHANVNIIDDITKSMADLINLNKKQSEKIIDYEKAIARIRRNNTDIVKQNRTLDDEIRYLRGKIKNYETIVSKLEKRNQELDDRVKEQSSVIKAQDREITSLKPSASSKEELLKLIQDANSLINNDERIYRRSA